MATATAGQYQGLDMGLFYPGWTTPPGLLDSPVLEATPTLYVVSGNWANPGVNRFYGEGFTYDHSLRLTGGVVTSWDAMGPSWEGGWLGTNGDLSGNSTNGVLSGNSTPEGAVNYSIQQISLPGVILAGWLAKGGDYPDLAGRLLFRGHDTLVGGPFGDFLYGSGGDTIFGGAGDDWLSGPERGSGGSDRSIFIRGDDGADFIQGGDGFDDLNGNRGNDVIQGQLGDDWVVGGKDDDLLFGDEGDDLVLGNLGNDTGNGGEGSDTLRGGQGDDSLTGGPGDDWLSGDLGSDTVSGGAGADVFHSFGDAGLDRVTDFDRAEGDRVQLDPGATYTVAQSEADTVISIAGGAQKVLVGVQMSSLTGDWIFLA
jgi:Ca2+-binding RTX toxin-like protein